MKKATKEILIARYVGELNFINDMIDLNAHNENFVKQLQKEYRILTNLLTELSKVKPDDE